MFDFGELLQDNQGVITTARQQARVNELDQDELIWDTLFPRQDVDSIKINEIRLPDRRPVADRREYDGEGRRIPLATPGQMDAEMIPVSTYFQYGEYELQRLSEQVDGQQDLVMERINARIPDRVDTNVDAVFRRIELDVHKAWLEGKIDVKNPQDGSTHEASFHFDGARYPSQDYVAGNAYELFIQHANEAQKRIRGGVAGAIMPDAVLTEILNDAPVTGQNDLRMTRREFRDRIGAELDQSFSISIGDNRTADVFDGPGNDTTEQDYWSEGKIGFVPRGGTIGSTAFAPIARAYSYRGDAGDRVDVRSVSVFYILSNDGKNMKVETQLNALPIPQEPFVYVVDSQVPNPAL